MWESSFVGVLFTPRARDASSELELLHEAIVQPSRAVEHLSHCILMSVTLRCELTVELEPVLSQSVSGYATISGGGGSELAPEALPGGGRTRRKAASGFNPSANKRITWNSSFLDSGGTGLRRLFHIRVEVYSLS